MELIPPQDERDRLLDELARLVDDAGTGALLAAPIVRPDLRFYARWSPDALGVERLLDGLVRHAGVARMPRDVELAEYDAVDAWFSADLDDTYHFGVDVHGLGDRAQLAGALAHEVAHAFRHHHALGRPDPAIDEPLTDLTSVYLGFGILTANASLRVRGEHRVYIGYLPVQSLCWLLAAQVLARGEQPRAIARWLDPIQAACFGAACDALPARSGLLSRAA